MPFFKDAPAGSSIVSTLDVEDRSVGSEISALWTVFLRNSCPAGLAVVTGTGGAGAVLGNELYVKGADMADTGVVLLGENGDGSGDGRDAGMRPVTLFELG